MTKIFSGSYKGRKVFAGILLGSLLLSLGVAAEIPEPANSTFDDFGNLEVDFLRSEIMVRGWVSQRSDAVLFLGVAAGGMDHLSALVLDAQPRQLENALAALGLEPHNQTCLNTPFQPIQGSPVRMWLEWGKRRRLPADQIFRRVSGRQGPVDWLFTGSATDQEGKYMADLEHSLVANFRNPHAIIVTEFFIPYNFERKRDVVTINEKKNAPASKVAGEYEVLELTPGVLPPAGTPVRLIIRPDYRSHRLHKK